MDFVSEFILQFHNLQGDTVGERKKNLFKLISNITILHNEQVQNLTLEKLKPKTYQENIFYVDILIHFKKTEKLLEILKDGNQLLATKILKQTWFLEQAFNNIDVLELVTVYMPMFSYVVRKKLIKNLSKIWDEERIDCLFYLIYDKYGLPTALPLLPKCYDYTIQQFIVENDILFKPNQVIELFDKNENMLKHYLEHFKNLTETVYSEKKVVQYVGFKNPKLLILLEKSKLICANSVGRRTTKNIVKMSKDDIFNNCEQYLSFLNKSVVIRKLGTEFKVFFKQIFPKSFLQLSNFCINNDIIKYYPKNSRWQLFKETCSYHFANKTEIDILMVLGPEFLKYQPPQETLFTWAAIKYENRETDYENYLKYYPAAKAIKIITEKIGITSDVKRINYLLDLLINMCAMNKDAASLEIILDYVFTRQRKEISSIAYLLTSIRNIYKLENLNEKHWKLIYDMLTVLKISKDVDYNWNAELKKYYLKFMVENDKVVEQVFIDYFKELMENCCFYDMRCSDNAALERKIRIYFCNLVPNIPLEELQEKNEEAILSFICSTIKFSVDNPNYCINLNQYPEIVSAVMSVFNKDKFKWYDFDTIPKVIIYNDTFPQYVFQIPNDTLLKRFESAVIEQSNLWTFKEIFDKVVKKKNRTAFGNDLLYLYMNNLYNEYPDGTVVDWLLKNEPRMLIPYYDAILKSNITNKYDKCLDIKLIKQYSHLDFDKRLKEFYQKQLNETNKDDIDTIKKCIARSFSVFTPEEIIKIVEEKFLPKSDKLDLEDQEMRDTYNIQLYIAKRLGEVDEPYKMLPTIMKFAKGDYLQSALPSLYTAFYRSPEKLLYPYVVQLSKRAVSVRKHAVFLTCAVLNAEYTLSMLKKSNEENTSSRKHLFSATLKYLVKNPLRDLFNKIMDGLKFIDKNDTETFELLITVNMPRKFLQYYLEKCWYFYESLEANNIKIDGYLEKLLSNMSKNILPFLSENFVTHVILKYFGKKIVGFEMFVIKVLRDRTLNRIANFNLVFDLLSISSENTVNDFYKAFMDFALHAEFDEPVFFYLFYEYWCKTIVITSHLRSHISLKLLLLRFENSSIEIFAQKVIEFMDDLILDLTVLVVPTFKEELLAKLLTFDEMDKFRCLLAMLNYKKNADVCVLVLQLLSHVHEDDRKELREIYTNILNIIGDIKTPVVIAYYKIHLTCINSQ